MFDWILRPFGVFDIENKYVWRHNEDTVADCPYCLGFWINLALLPLFYFITNDTYTFDTYIFLVLSVPMVAGFINERLL